MRCRLGMCLGMRRRTYPKGLCRPVTPLANGGEDGRPLGRGTVHRERLDTDVREGPMRSTTHGGLLLTRRPLDTFHGHRRCKRSSQRPLLQVLLWVGFLQKRGSMETRNLRTNHPGPTPHSREVLPPVGTLYHWWIVLDRKE